MSVVSEEQFAQLERYVVSLEHRLRGVEELQPAHVEVVRNLTQCALESAGALKALAIVSAALFASLGDTVDRDVTRTVVLDHLASNEDAGAAELARSILDAPDPRAVLASLAPDLRLN